MTAAPSILVFGRTGQVAVELRRLAGTGAAPNPTVEALGRDRADLTDARACAAQIAATGAGLVINAAAWTDVDGAEDEPDAAYAVNAEAPGAMARAAAARGLPFLHVSTDYVFDGDGARPLREDDPATPLGVYGRSKLAGERAVAQAGGAHAILRTARVYAARGRNFPRAVLRAATRGERLRVVDDQIGGPTPARDVARALLAIARAFHEGRGKTGLYHYCGRPPVSWHGFAQAVVEAAGLAAEVAPVSSRDRPARAPRPTYAVLDCGKIARDYGIAQPDWRRSLKDIVTDITAGETGTRREPK